MYTVVERKYISNTDNIITTRNTIKSARLRPNSKTK